MVERICPQCQHGNALDNRFCGHCGASLDRNQIQPREETSLVLAGRQLPVQQLKQVGQAVAVSLVALAAEAGLAWLRRRVEQINMPSQAGSQPSTALVPSNRPTHQPAPPSTTNTVTIMSQRIVEVWEQGNLTRQTIERSFWRREG